MSATVPAATTVAHGKSALASPPPAVLGLVTAFCQSLDMPPGTAVSSDNPRFIGAVMGSLRRQPVTLDAVKARFVALRSNAVFQRTVIALEQRTSDGQFGSWTAELPQLQRLFWQRPVDGDAGEGGGGVRAPSESSVGAGDASSLPESNSLESAVAGVLFAFVSGAGSFLRPDMRERWADLQQACARAAAAVAGEGPQHQDDKKHQSQAQSAKVDAAPFVQPTAPIADVEAGARGTDRRQPAHAPAQRPQQQQQQQQQPLCQQGEELARCRQAVVDRWGLWARGALEQGLKDNLRLMFRLRMGKVAGAQEEFESLWVGATTLWARERAQ